MRILYVTADLSWPLSFGGDIRRWNILQGLQLAGVTDVLVFRRENKRIAGEAYAGCRNVVVVEDLPAGLVGLQRQRYSSFIGRGLLTLGNSLPFEYQPDRPCEWRSRSDSEIDPQYYDVVWFATARCAVLFGLIDSTTSVLDGDDFAYLRNWLILKNSPWYGAKVWNYIDVVKQWWWERTFSRRFSYVVRCSKEDRNRHRSRNVVVIPNGAHIPSKPERSPQRCVLFVGDPGYEPNFQGLTWFLNRVWPEIRVRVPDAKFDIVGRNPPDDISCFNGNMGVSVHGFVQNLSLFYRDASLSIVPLMAGGGTRLKILESIASAVPVVSTTIGAFGIGAGATQGVDLSDAPETFAERCVSLLIDPEAGIIRALKGREFVKSRYDWTVIQKRVAALARKTKASRHRTVGLIEAI